MVFESPGFRRMLAMGGDIWPHVDALLQAKAEGRNRTVAAVANACLFMASDVSRQITGVALKDESGGGTSSVLASRCDKSAT